jgi:hypothetical protein
MYPERFSDSYFCLRLSEPQSHSAAEGLGKLKKFSDVGNQTCDLAALCSDLTAGRWHNSVLTAH